MTTVEVAPGQGDPRRSWVLGLGALALLGVFGWVSGSCRRLAGAPLLRPGHGAAFWSALGACVVVEVVAYAVVWPIGTVTLGRPRTPWSVVFGLVWGLTQGIVFLGIYELSGSVVVTIIAASAFQGVWHAGFWDRHVSPPHNDPAGNARKVAFAHTPNLVASTVFLGVWGEAWAYVGFQVLALVQCCRVMRFPSPFATIDTRTGAI